MGAVANGRNSFGKARKICNAPDCHWAHGSCAVTVGISVAGVSEIKIRHKKKSMKSWRQGGGANWGQKTTKRRSSPTPEGHLLEAIAHGLDHSTDTRASGGTSNRGRFLGRWPSIGMHPSVHRLRCLAWTLARNTRVGANRRKNTPGCGLPLLRSLRWPLDVLFIGFYDLSEDLHFPLEVLSFFSCLHCILWHSLFLWS